MERDEAERTGLAVITPEALRVTARREASRGPASFLASLMEGVLEVAEIAPGPIALAGHAPAGALAEALASLIAQGWSAVDGGSIVRSIRKEKTPEEVAGIRHASQAVMSAFRAVAERLAASQARDGELWSEGERLTLGRLRGEIGRILGAAGCEQPRGAIVAAGEDSGVPHSSGEDAHVLRAGESLVVDIFPRRGALFSDCTRTFCVGTPSEPLFKAHQEVERALAGAESSAQVGMAAWDLHSGVAESFTRAGYPTLLTHPETTVGFVHTLGHGVGYELHEQPIFRRNSGPAGELAEGDVVTLEPGLYNPGEGYGVRIEDLYVLGSDGLEILTPLPRDLDPRAWTFTSKR
jgi:Xaa-Pro aminopeptidase